MTYLTWHWHWLPVRQERIVRLLAFLMSGVKRSIETIDVIEGGKLKVDVFFVRTTLWSSPRRLWLTGLLCCLKHDVVVKTGSVQPAWTFVTRGLFEKGSKELVMTLKCAPGEIAEAFKTGGRNFPEAVLHLFANIYEDHFDNAEEGHIDEAMWYEWPHFEGAESPYFLGKAKWTSFIFGPADYLGYSDLEGLFLGQQPYMSVQPIFEDEYQIAKHFGVTRVMAMMGQHLQAYPWPRVVDRDRPSVIPSNIDAAKCRSENKVFDAGEQVVLSDLCAVLDLEKKSVSIRIPQHQVPLIKAHLDELAPSSGLIFNLTLAPHADSHLYWNPSSKTSSSEFHFIKKPTSTGSEGEPKPTLIGGSFIAFVPRGTSDFITIHEDGFVAMVSPLSWTALRQCLSNGINCKIASDLPSGLELDLAFSDDDLPEDEPQEDATDFSEPQPSSSDAQ